MDKTFKVFIYLSSIAWLIFTITSLERTTEAMVNGIITAIVTIINMIINDLIKD